MNRATAILRPAQPRPAVFRYGQGRCWRCPTTARVAQCRMLDNSATILQDDSGIPLADFEAKSWRLQRLGIMLGHISLRKLLPIPNGEAVSKVPARWNSGLDTDGARTSSNLLLAQKESPPGSDEELTPLSQAEGNAAGTAAGAVDTVQHHELSLLNRRMHQPALK